MAAAMTTAIEAEMTPAAESADVVDDGDSHENERQLASRPLPL